MTFQKNVRTVAHTIANWPWEVPTSSTRRRLFAATYKLLAHASLLDPALVVLAVAALAGGR